MWWWMPQKWWWFFLCSGPIILFLLLSTFPLGECCLFLLFNTRWVMWEAQTMVLRGVWRFVRHLWFLDVLLCLFPSAMGSGALDGWGNRALSRRCFWLFSEVLSVSLQQFWPHHAVCTHNQKRRDGCLFHLELYPGWCCASPLGNEWAGYENIPLQVVHILLQTHFLN